MTKKDINDIISIICPNDEDFEKTCISPAYLKKELEVLALEQEPILDKIRADAEWLKELKQMQEQEPCDDAISRQAVLDMATTIQTDDCSGNEVMEVVDVDDIKTLPRVILTHKKGKWIDTDETILNRQGYLVHEVICSECNGISYFRKMGNKYIGANLCPNCGAKIDAYKAESKAESENKE